MRFLLSLLTVFFVPWSWAQLNFEMPMDSSMLDTSTGVTGRLNQVDQSSDGQAGRDQHVERQEEEADFFDEDEYTEQSDAEFNRNWDQETQSITLPD